MSASVIVGEWPAPIGPCSALVRQRIGSGHGSHRSAVDDARIDLRRTLIVASRCVSPSRDRRIAGSSRVASVPPRVVAGNSGREVREQPRAR